MRSFSNVSELRRPILGPKLHGDSQSVHLEHDFDFTLHWLTVPEAPGG
jgi:hypothetical protein